MYLLRALSLLALGYALLLHFVLLFALCAFVFRCIYRKLVYKKFLLLRFISLLVLCYVFLIHFMFLLVLCMFELQYKNKTVYKKSYKPRKYIYSRTCRLNSFIKIKPVKTFIQKQNDNPIFNVVMSSMSDVNLDNTTIVLLANNIVTIITLSLVAIFSGAGKFNKFILLPIVSSVLSLAYAIYQLEGSNLYNFTIAGVMQLMNEKQEDEYTTDIDKNNKKIAEKNVCRTEKLPAFIQLKYPLLLSTKEFRANPALVEKVQQQKYYLAKLAHVHGLETVAKVYQFSTSEKMIVNATKLKYFSSNEPEENEHPNRVDNVSHSPLTKASLNAPLDSTTPIGKDKESNEPSEMLSHDNPQPSTSGYQSLLIKRKVEQLQDSDDSDYDDSEEDEVIVHSPVIEKQELRPGLLQPVRIILGLIALVFAPLITSVSDKFLEGRAIVNLSKTIQATNVVFSAAGDMGTYLMDLIGVRPTEFSLEYHILEYTRQLNHFNSLPFNMIVENNIYLHEIKNTIYEVELFLRKVPASQEKSVVGLRGLHISATNTLNSILRTNKLSGSRQEARLVLLYGEASVGKTRLAKEMIVRLGSALFPDIEEHQRSIQITAGSKYWPGLSGQPIAFFDECDANKVENSLLFSNLKGLCSTAVFNCEGAAVEHKHQPAPFKVLIGTTNLDIRELQKQFAEFYGRQSLDPLWSRIIFVKVERNSAYGPIDIMNRESARYDTGGEFGHCLLRTHVMCDKEKIPVPAAKVTLSQLVGQLVSRFQILTSQHMVMNQQSGNAKRHLSVALYGPSGEGKSTCIEETVGLVKARFELKASQVHVSDDKMQLGEFSEQDYLAAYNSATDGSLFLNAENTSSISWGWHWQFVNMSIVVTPIVRSAFEAFPRRFGLFHSQHVSATHLSVKYTRSQSFVNIRYRFCCWLALVPCALLLSILSGCWLALLVPLFAYYVVVYVRYELMPISIEYDVVPTDKLPNYIAQKYHELIASSRELQLVEGTCPDTSIPELEIRTPTTAELSVFGTGSALKHVFTDRLAFQQSLLDVKLYITPYMIGKILPYLSQLNYLRISNSLPEQHKIANKFAQICKTVNSSHIKTIVSFSERTFTIFNGTLYVSDTRNLVLDGISEINDGIVYNDVFLSWEGVLSVLEGADNLNSLLNGSEIDYIHLRKLLQEYHSHPRICELRSNNFDRNITRVKQTSTLLWNEFYMFFKSTITGKVLAALVLSLLCYLLYNSFTSSDDVSTSGKNSYVEEWLANARQQANRKTGRHGKRRDRFGTEPDLDLQANRKAKGRKKDRFGTEPDLDLQANGKGKKKIRCGTDYNGEVIRHVTKQSVHKLPPVTSEPTLSQEKAFFKSKIQKNLLHVYAIPKDISEDIISRMTVENLDAMFPRNYALAVNNSQAVTVGHIAQKSNTALYILCDEKCNSNGDPIPIKVKTSLLSYSRDVAVLDIAPLKSSFKNLVKYFPDSFEEFESNPQRTILGRYNQDKEIEFHGGSLFYDPDEDSGYDCEGEPYSLNKFFWTHYGVVNSPITVNGDCGLPYLTLFQGKIVITGIHSMSVRTGREFYTMSPGLLKSDFITLEKQSNSCVGCLKDSQKWCDPTSEKKKNDSHKILWSKLCGNNINNMVELIDSVERLDWTETPYVYSTYIGPYGSVQNHQHLQRWHESEIRREQCGYDAQQRRLNLQFLTLKQLTRFIGKEMNNTRFHLTFDTYGETIFCCFVFEEDQPNLIKFTQPTPNNQTNMEKWFKPETTAEVLIRKVDSDSKNKLFNINSQRISYISVLKRALPPFKSSFLKTLFHKDNNVAIGKFPFDAAKLPYSDDAMADRSGRDNPFLLHLSDVTDSPVSASPGLRSLLIKYKQDYEQRFSMYKNLRALECDEVLHGINKKSALSAGLNRLNLDTSVGFSLSSTYNVQKKNDIIECLDSGKVLWKDNDAALCLRREYEEAIKNIQDGKPVLTLFTDTLKDEKVKESKLHKGRQFSVADFLLILLERKFMGKLIAISTVQDPSVAVGMDPILDFHRIFTRMSKFPYHFTADFKAWDKKLPIYVYDHFFCVLISMNPHYAKELTAFREMYKYNYHVVENVLYEAKGTMPSGCAATANLNSLLNNFIFYTAYIILAEQRGEDASYAAYKQHVLEIAYGDDKWVSTDLEWFNSKTISRVIADFYGMDMGSSEKDTDAKPFMSFDEISFISRYPRKMKNGIVVGALKKITIESYFHWTKDASPAHQGLLLSTASYESQLWGDEYGSFINGEINQILEKYSILQPHVKLFTHRELMWDISNKLVFHKILQSGLAAPVDLNTSESFNKQIKFVNTKYFCKTRQMAFNNKKLYTNNLVELNERSQKENFSLNWSFVQIDGNWIGTLDIVRNQEVLWSFTSTGITKNIVKHHIAEMYFSTREKQSYRPLLQDTDKRFRRPGIYTPSKQSSRPTGAGIDVTHGDAIPIAKVDSVDPTLAAGNTFYTNTRIAVRCEDINPVAIALNNPAGSGAPFDKKDSVYNLYQPWITTSVNGSQQSGTEVLRISLDPSTLPNSIKEYVAFHEDIIPAIDVAVFINGTAGGLGTLLIGWVNDASSGKTYTLSSLYNVSNKTMSLAQTTATQYTIRDIRKNGMFRKVVGDPEPFPGLVMLIDAPATNVQRNDNVEFPIRVYVRLAPECILMSPFSQTSSLAYDLPLSAFLSSEQIDIVTTGPGKLLSPDSTQQWPDGGFLTGDFNPFPIGGHIYAVSSTCPIPQSLKVLADSTITDEAVANAVGKDGEGTLYQSGGRVSQSSTPRSFRATRDAILPDVIYVAYGTVPSSRTFRSLQIIPGTKVSIPKIETYLQYKKGMKFDCNTAYIQDNGLGILLEFRLRGEWSMVVKAGVPYQIFRLKDGRASQIDGMNTYPDFVFVAGSCQPNNYKGIIVVGDTNPRSTSAPYIWPANFSGNNANAGIGVLGCAFTAAKNHDDTTGLIAPESLTLLHDETLSPFYYAAETTTGPQVALPTAMVLLTFARQGFSVLQTNLSVGVQPPAAPGFDRLLLLLESYAKAYGSRYIAFGLKYGPRQVELDAVYGNGCIMARGSNNLTRSAIPVNDCYIVNIRPIAEASGVSPLITALPSWRTNYAPVKQSWVPILSGIGQGLAAFGNASWAQQTDGLNRELALQLAEIKGQNMLNLENQRFNNSMALVGASAGATQSMMRPSFNLNSGNSSYQFVKGGTLAPSEPYIIENGNKTVLNKNKDKGLNPEAPDFEPKPSTSFVNV